MFWGHNNNEETFLMQYWKAQYHKESSVTRKFLKDVKDRGLRLFTAINIHAL